MSQVASDFSGQAEAQGEAQGGAQVAEQQAQGSVVDGQQQQSQAPVDELGVRVSYDNFKNLDVGRDFNKVIHMANQYKEFEQGGHVALAQQAKEAGLDGFQLASHFRAQGAGGQQAQQGAAHVQQAEQNAQQGVQQGSISPEQAQQMIASAVQDVEDRIGQKQTAASEQVEFDRLSKIEQDTYVSVLDGMGIKSNPSNMNFMGADTDMDPHFDMVKNHLERTTQSVIDSQLNKNDPNYESLRMQPATAEQIQSAADFIKPFLATMGERYVQQAADEQETIPQESLANGLGGRAQADSTTPRTPDQVKAQVLANVRAKGGLKGIR